jgi:flagellar biosynthetic protein FliR
MDFVAYSFMTALRIAGPFFIYSFGVNLVFGLASKLVPQFPGFFLSIPVLLIGGLYTIYLLLSDISQISVDGISWIISRL